jgi:hypothetical protein
MANRGLGSVASAVACSKCAVKSSSTALVVDKALPVIANGRTVIVVDSTGKAAPTTLKGTAAAEAEPALLDGTAYVVDSDGNAVPVILNGTTVVDSDGNEIPVILDGTAPAVDSDDNALHGTALSDGAKARKVLIWVAGGAVVGCVVLNPVGLAALSAAGFTSIGPAAGSSAALWMSSIAASSGVGVQAGSLYALFQSTAMTGGGWLLGAPVTSTVGAAVGGGWAWLSSKLRRTTTSSSKGCDPGCDVEEKSMQRCSTCGTPVAPVTSRAF